jgi:hypothetical protein
MAHVDLGTLMREYKIPQVVMLKLLDAVIDQVMEDDIESIRSQFSGSEAPIRVLSPAIQDVPPFVATFLSISGRVATIMFQLDAISKVHREAPATAMDMVATIRHLISGDHQQESLASMCNGYDYQLQDELQSRELKRQASLAEDEVDVESEVGRYDPLPREKYDPFRHE